MWDDETLGKLIIESVDASKLNALDEDNRNRLQITLIEHFDNYQKEAYDGQFDIQISVVIEEPNIFVMNVAVEDMDDGNFKISQFKVMGEML